MNGQPIKSDFNTAAPATPAKLLVIDASSLIHRLLQTRLGNDRLVIHSATDATRGLELAGQIIPEVILLDFELPDMDGFEILRTLKADHRTNSIPVIFLSGSASTEQKVHAFEMGAIDFVPKPFNTAELRARVRSALRMTGMIRMLSQRARLDGLTGLWNRDYFDHRLSQEVSTALRHGNTVGLVMCDIDHFKSVNDAFGHPFGDLVLEEFALLLGACRDSDICCRYGGEEFAIILPQTTAEQALVMIDRVRTQMADSRWQDHPELMVTTSFGISDTARLMQKTARDLVISADRALYCAKNNGRNRIEIASPLPGTSRKCVA